MLLNEVTAESAVQYFDVKSGALQVTDPCYSPDTWCAGFVTNVLNGKWQAKVGYFKDAMDMQMVNERRAAELQMHDDQIKAWKDMGMTEDALTPYRLMVEHIQQEWAQEDAEYKGRVGYLRITHDNFAGDAPDSLDDFTPVEIDVGVDSGQAGFFDRDQWLPVAASNDHKDTPEHEAFYDCVCGLTLGDNSFGAIEYGAVSSTGYGDGSYDCRVRKDASGAIIDAVILFISDGTEDEDGDE